MLFCDNWWDFLKFSTKPHLWTYLSLSPRGNVWTTVTNSVTCYTSVSYNVHCVLPSFVETFTNCCLLWERNLLNNTNTWSVQKVSRIWNFRGLRIFDFLWRYVGTHITYAGKFDHFECSVNFWQLFCLDVFRLACDFCLFSLGDKKKSQGARSGEYGGCGNIIVLFLVKILRTSKYVCVGALSWCKSQFLFFHKSGRLWRIASRILRTTCR